MSKLFAALACVGLAACARAEAIRTSQNTMVIDAGAAPACGQAGAARVASKSAAVETIRAGYERYLIGGMQAQNNVSVTQMPGSVQTTGTYGRGNYQATSTYVPGPTIVAGSHDRQLSVVMFKPGDPGFEQALDAKQMLGSDWAELVKTGIRTCL